MPTTVAIIDAELRVDGRGVPRQVKKLGREAGDEFSGGFGDTLERELSDIANVRLENMREQFQREGRKSGRIFGLTMRQAVDNEIKQLVNSATTDLAKVFTFDDDGEGFQRLVVQMGSVDEAAARMRKSLALANDEGRIENETFAVLNDRLDEYVGRARRVESADRAMVGQKDALIRYQDKLEQQLSSGKAFERHTREVGNLDRAYKSLWTRIDELERGGGGQRWADRMRLKLMDLTDSAKRAGNETEKMGFKWGNIPHNGRQVILIITALIAAFDQLAVLGSAAGAGLVVLGSSIFGLVAGLGVAAMAFADINKPLDEMPESTHAAIVAFDGVQAAWGRLQDRVSERVLSQVASAFDVLAGLADRLVPGFDSVSDAIVRATNKLADLLNQDANVEVMNKALENGGKTFELLVDLAGDLLVAILKVFANPEVQRSTEEFIGYIDDLVASFDEFTQNGGLDEWMSNARTIFGELGELLSATGSLLDNLVTPETVARTADFIDSLTGAMPFLESLFVFAGELNIFGILAQALETLGAFLGPVLDALAPLADYISTILMKMLEWSEIIFNVLAPALIPLEVWWNILSLALEKFLEWADPVFVALQDLGEEVSNLGQDIWTELEPAIGDLLDAFLELLPSPEEAARIIREDVIPAVRDAADWVANTMIPALKDFIEYLDNVIESLGGWDGISQKLSAIGGAFRLFGGVVAAALQPAINLINGLADAIRWVLNNLPGANAISGGGGGGGRAPTATAIGGTFYSAQNRLIAEAGPEMVVPLDRPLSQVDPSVRDVSAYAQGLTPGGGRGGTTHVVFQAGAIVVQGAGDPGAVARAVYDEFAEKLNG